MGNNAADETKRNLQEATPRFEKIIFNHNTECLLNEENLKKFHSNPIGIFKQWFQQAFQFQVPEPFIMTLATSCLKGIPRVRPVALCNVDDKGLYFSTNKNSQKVKDLNENPRVEACFYWSKLDRVVRIQGETEECEDQAASFHSWPRLSQIIEHSKYVTGECVAERKDLLTDFDFLTAKFAAIDVIPQPDCIQTYCIVPTRIEFMQVHIALPVDRIIFNRSSTGGSWNHSTLAR